jgi:hypothetical protein
VAWFLINDRVKLLAYRIFDPTQVPLLAKKPFDLTPQIATRAYELYEQRGRGEGQVGQDWLEAEREIRKDQAGEAKAASTTSWACVARRPTAFTLKTRLPHLVNSMVHHRFFKGGRVNRHGAIVP